jgi:hypothetical protein
MSASLGTVSATGVVYFHALDINDCRAFLRKMGLECGRRGWSGNGYLGALWLHDQYGWEAAAWKSDLADDTHTKGQQ